MEALVPAPSVPQIAGARPGTDARPLSRRLRILHILNRAGVGGTEYGAMKIVSGLSGERFEHRICTTRGVDPGFSWNASTGSSDVYCVGSTNIGFQFLIFRLMRIMKAYKPHVVHSRNWGAIEAILAARLSGVPVVIHSEHGYEVESISGLPGRQRFLRRALYPLADAVFTVTDELRRYHAKQAWTDPARLRVIYNGVDTLRFSPRPEIGMRIRADLGIPQARFVVGAVGRMVAIKDYPTLLRAADLLGRKGIDFHLLMVGSGPELERLRSAASQAQALQGRFTFVGASGDVSGLLNAMDVFVLASLSEGMSNTLLEAMSTGIPVVVTRVGGNPELISGEEYGILFPPGAVDELCNHLARLATHPDECRQLGEAARGRALQHFSLARMLAAYGELYVTLAQKRGVLEAEKA